MSKYIGESLKAAVAASRTVFPTEATPIITKPIGYVKKMSNRRVKPNQNEKAKQVSNSCSFTIC